VQPSNDTLRVQDDKLTEKQRQSLPYLAAADNIHQGVMKILELGIISTKEYFYRKWRHQPMFMKRLMLERERVQGDVKDLVTNQVFVEAERTIFELQKIAFCSPDSPYVTQKVRALEDLLLMMGLEISRASKVDVSVSTHLKTKQAAFRDLIEEGQRVRHGAIGGGVPRIPNGRKGPSRN
jgi:hypothetical protein